MNPYYWVILAVCLLALAVRSGYERLKEKKTVDTNSKLVFGVVFAAMGLMLTSWIGLGLFDPWRVTPAPLVRWVGMALLIIGLGVAVGAMIQLGGLENIDHLVSSGFFSKLRHPMYTGFIFWIAGWLLFFGAIASTFAGVIAIANILYWRSLEEQKLLHDYGPDFREYQKRSWF